MPRRAPASNYCLDQFLLCYVAQKHCSCQLFFFWLPNGAITAFCIHLDPMKMYIPNPVQCTGELNPTEGLNSCRFTVEWLLNDLLDKLEWVLTTGISILICLFCEKLQQTNFVLFNGVSLQISCCKKCHQRKCRWLCQGIFTPSL